MTTDNATSNYIIENSLDSIKLTIHGRKMWITFFMSLFVLVINGFCFLPIVGLIVGAALQKYLPEWFSIFTGVLIFAIWFYIIYTKSQETLGFILDKETVEIDNQAIRIEKSGLGFKNIKVYSSENIKGITLLFPNSGPSIWLKGLPFISTNIDTLILFHEQKKFRFFGKSLTASDAQIVLDTILNKFPQYKYAGGS